MESVLRVGLAVYGVLAVATAAILPTVRLRLRDGAWPFTATARRGALELACGTGLVLSTLGYGAWVACYAALGARPLGLWRVPAWASLAGLGVSLTGLALTVMAQHQMGSCWRIGLDEQPGALVTAGLFRRVRNPVFAGLILQACGVTLVAPAPWSVALMLAVVVLLGVQTRLEERHLSRRYGEQYRAYARRAGRFVPFVGRLKVKRTDRPGG